MKKSLSLPTTMSHSLLTTRSLSLLTNRPLALLTTLLAFLSLHAQSQSKDSLYFVRLRDGSILYSNKVQLVSSLSRGKYLLLDSSKQLPLSQVREFKGWDGTFAVAAIGSRFDAYKLQNEGRRISLYAQCYESTTTIYGSPTPGGVATPTTVTTYQRALFFRKGTDGDIQPLNYHNLKIALADNPASIQELHIAHTNLYLGIGLLAGGAALTIAGIVQTKHRNDDAYNAFKTASDNWFRIAQANPWSTTPPPPAPAHYGLSPLFYIGAATTLSAMVPIFTMGKHARRALDMYNGIN